MVFLFRRRRAGFGLRLTRCGVGASAEEEVEGGVALSSGEIWFSVVFIAVPFSAARSQGTESAKSGGPHGPPVFAERSQPGDRESTCGASSRAAGFGSDQRDENTFKIKYVNIKCYFLV